MSLKGSIHLQGMSMLSIKALFWFGIFIVFYAYLGYGMLLWLLLHVKRRPQSYIETLIPPDVTFIVCAYNEEDWIAQKIENSLAVNYPRQHITFFFVTDGSDDATAKIVAEYPYPADVQWKLLHQP